MTALETAIKKTKLLKRELELIPSLLGQKKVQEKLIELNQFDQIFIKGQRADGSTLPLYSLNTQILSFGERYTLNGVTKTKLQGEPFILLNSGRFFESFKINYTNEYLTIQADDDKDGKKLTELYGKEILGLSEESKIKAKKFIEDIVFENLKKKGF